MTARIDPAAWPNRVQLAALGLVTGAALLAEFLWPDGVTVLVAGFVPAAGALIWRFERARLRDIASWTVPLGLGLLVAGRLPSPFNFTVSLLGVAILVAMMFSNAARDGWLRLVAPGTYRVFGKPDREIADKLATFDAEAFEAIEQYTHDGSDTKLRRRLDRVTTSARGLSIADPEWKHVRQLYLDWLASCLNIASDREAGSAAFDDMAKRRDSFERARGAMADARSHDLGTKRQAGRPRS